MCIREKTEIYRFVHIILHILIIHNNIILLYYIILLF